MVFIENVAIAALAVLIVELGKSLLRWALKKRR